MLQLDSERKYWLDNYLCYKNLYPFSDVVEAASKGQFDANDKKLKVRRKSMFLTVLGN